VPPIISSGVSGGEDEEQLVAERAERDLADHRQFALWLEPDHVARRHRGIVDHHADRLAAGLAGGRCDIVEARGGELGDPGNVVEQCDQSCGHRGCP